MPLNTSSDKNTTQDVEFFNDLDTYRSAISDLLFLSVNTRPSICIANSILGRKVTQPHKNDWLVVKRCMKYLKGTMDLYVKLGEGSEWENRE